ncbi:MAG: hypothetical protein D4R81_01055 [Nitrospiraceae bacterium]|nr:MAG: hypothetical protein D4R81_01055 [Nitrospiraceae bacterium]
MQERADLFLDGRFFLERYAFERIWPSELCLDKSFDRLVHVRVLFVVALQVLLAPFQAISERLRGICRDILNNGIIHNVIHGTFEPLTCLLQKMMKTSGYGERLLIIHDL